MKENNESFEGKKKKRMARKKSQDASKVLWFTNIFTTAPVEHLEVTPIVLLSPSFR